MSVMAGGCPDGSAEGCHVRHGKTKGRTCCRPRESRQVRPEANAKTFSDYWAADGAASLDAACRSRFPDSQSLIHPILSQFQIRLAGFIVRVNLRLLTVHQVEIDHRIGVVRFELDGLFQSIEALLDQRPILFGESACGVFPGSPATHPDGRDPWAWSMSWSFRTVCARGKQMAQSSTPIQ